MYASCHTTNGRRKERRQHMSMFGRQPAADILKERGIRREAAAKTIGVKHSVLNNTLAGRQTPSTEIREGLVKLLGMPLEELFDAEPLARVKGRRYRQGAMISKGEDPTIKHRKRRSKRGTNDDVTELNERRVNDAGTTEQRVPGPTVNEAVANTGSLHSA
jgi:transcriptional regulator with XRE-family HTH domain